MDKEELILERRGVWIGKADEYSEALHRELKALCKVSFRFAADAKELTKLLYDYEPMLILGIMDLDTIGALLKVYELPRYRRSVSLGLVYDESEGMRSFSERYVVTDIVKMSGQPRGDAFDVYRYYVYHMKYGVNLKTITKSMPIVTDLVWHDISAEYRSQQKALSDKLARLGVRRELAGHKYLIGAIALQSAIHEAPKPAKLYENVADYFGVTPLAVEKAIRYAIEDAWTVGDIDYQHELFGMSIDEEKGKPTNAEFIARLAIDYK